MLSDYKHNDIDDEERQEDDVISVLKCEIYMSQIIPRKKLLHCRPQTDGTFVALLDKTDHLQNGRIHQVLCKPAAHLIESSSGDWPELLALQKLPRSNKILNFLGVCIDFKTPNLRVSQPVLVVDYHRGTLFDYVKEGYINVNNVSVFSNEMAQCIAHVHQNGFIHRDITLKSFYVHHGAVLGNLVYAKALQSPTRKSFGDRKLSDTLPESSWRFQAPETLYDQTSSRKSDIWMFGISIWQLLERAAPFKKMISKIQLISFFSDKKSKLHEELFKSSLWRQEQMLGFREVLSICCVMSPHERPTIEDVCKKLSKIDLRTSSPQKARSPRSPYEKSQEEDEEDFTEMEIVDLNEEKNRISSISSIEAYRDDLKSSSSSSSSLPNLSPKQKRDGYSKIKSTDDLTATATATSNQTDQEGTDRNINYERFQFMTSLQLPFRGSPSSSAILTTPREGEFSGFGSHLEHPPITVSELDWTCSNCGGLNEGLHPNCPECRLKNAERIASPRAIGVAGHGATDEQFQSVKEKIELQKAHKTESQRAAEDADMRKAIRLKVLELRKAQEEQEIKKQENSQKTKCGPKCCIVM